MTGVETFLIVALAASWALLVIAAERHRRMALAAGAALALLGLTAVDDDGAIARHVHLDDVIRFVAEGRKTIVKVVDNEVIITAGGR